MAKNYLAEPSDKNLATLDDLGALEQNQKHAGFIRNIIRQAQKDHNRKVVNPLCVEPLKREIAAANRLIDGLVKEAKQTAALLKVSYEEPEIVRSLRAFCQIKGNLL